MNSPAYIKYLSLTPRVKSLQCIHVGDQEGLCFCTLEQNRPYQCLIQVYFDADTQKTAVPYLCREFITEQASPILRRTSGRQ